MTMKYEWSDFQVGPEKGTVAAGFVEAVADLAELERQAELTDNLSADARSSSSAAGGQGESPDQPMTPALALAFGFLGVLAHEYIQAAKSCRPGTERPRETIAERRQRLRKRRERRNRRRKG